MARTGAGRPELVDIVLGDSPEVWRELGFAVEGEVMSVGGVRLRLGAEGEGIVGWSLRNLPEGADLDGLPTSRADVERAGTAGEPPDSVDHPNGATAVDHVVALTPDFDRTVGRLRDAGLDYRHTRDAGGGFSQAFFVLGPCLLELGGPAADGDVRFWGITFVVDDLDAASALLGNRLGRVKDAVQPGRRIATVRPEAVGMPVALMTPRG